MGEDLGQKVEGHGAEILSVSDVGELRGPLTEGREGASYTWRVGRDPKRMMSYKISHERGMVEMRGPTAQGWESRKGPEDTMVQGVGGSDTGVGGDTAAVPYTSISYRSGG